MDATPRSASQPEASDREQRADQEEQGSLIRAQAQHVVERSPHLAREIDVEPRGDNFEMEIIEDFNQKYPHKLNKHISSLITALSIDKKEDEISRSFEDRLFGEVQKILFQ